MPNLTPSQARFLAEQSRDIAPLPGNLAHHRGERLHERHGRADPPVPALVQWSPAIILALFFAVILGGIVLVGLAIEQTTKSQENVAALASSVEKMAEADLERARLDLERERLRAQEAEQRRLDDQRREQESQKGWAEAVLFMLLGALFIAVASRKDFLWGIGVGVAVIIIIGAIAYVPGLSDLARFLLVEDR